MESPDHVQFRYDEFALLEENCAEFGLPWTGSVEVERGWHPVEDGRRLSYLRWGGGPPRLVLLHGGAQNAHTWDTVLLALRPVPAVAVDLPGHGHSDWRPGADYDPRSAADDLAGLLAGIGAPVVVVGMSLGGLTATALAARHPHLVERLTLVDITPGVNRAKAQAVHAFIEGPQSFDSFDELLERTVTFNPGRSVSSLRRGILHNARRLPSGKWEWRYDRRPLVEPQARGDGVADLWDDVSAVRSPVRLIRGGDSPVVDAADVAELRRRVPGVKVDVVTGAGHSVQGDRPVELAGLVSEDLELSG